MKNLVSKIKVFVKYAAYIVLLMETLNFFITGSEKIVIEPTKDNENG